MSDDGHWPVRDDIPFLPDATLHLWSVNLDRLLGRVPELRRVLAPDELERAGRFRFERDSARFIVGRGVLRQFLAGYSGARAAEVALNYGEHGKPGLADANRSTVRFNLAHCGGTALFGFTRSTEIGVDIERVSAFDDMHAVMRSSFSPAEREGINVLPREDHAAAFFRCWTRKEAVLKAMGSGLAKPLDSFDVSTDAGEPRVLRMTDDVPDAWHLIHLVPAPGFVGAAAWVGAPLSVDRFAYGP